MGVVLTERNISTLVIGLVFLEVNIRIEGSKGAKYRFGVLHEHFLKEPVVRFSLTLLWRSNSASSWILCG